MKDVLPGLKTVIVVLLYVALKWSEKLVGIDVPEEVYTSLMGVGALTFKMGIERSAKK